MCGIAGSLVLDGDSGPTRVDAPLRALRHRGPDGEGTWSDDRCELGQRRLAVIDLSEAAQGPLSNEDGTVWITFNGEIYNFQQLRRELERYGHRFRSATDTEVIVHAYEQWGTDCIKQFRGMFAFAVWDQRRQRLLLARDRVGKKPLFFTHRGDQFLFASELQGLLAFPGVSAEVDRAALHTYLSWGYIPAPLTAFKGVEKLPPAHWLTIDISGHPHEQIERYWSLEYTPKRALSPDEARHTLHEVLSEAVRLRLISDVPLGAFLSGGIDSSIVVGLMAQLSSTPVKTFSIGFDEASYSELAHARRIAEKWGTEHHEHVVRPDALEVVPLLARHYGEPFADSSAIPTFYVAQVTRQEVTVALNGDGGDESFAGYDRYWGNRMAQKLRRFPGVAAISPKAAALMPNSDLKNPMARARRFLGAVGDPQSSRYARWMSYFDVLERQRVCTREFFEVCSPLAEPSWFDQLFTTAAIEDSAEAAMAVDINSYLPFDLLVKVDIAAMANSLEARSPFLDHEVMELAARLPADLKLRSRRGKRILTETFADLLPAENVDRPKMGFGVPVGTWFRGPLRDLLHDALLSQTAGDRGYFVMSEVERLVREHLEGIVDHTPQLWNLLMLEMWHREVVDR